MTRPAAGFLVLGAAALIGAARSAPAPIEPASAPTVVVLVIEALRHDYPERGAAPNLMKMAAEGGRADRLTPVFPPNSLPSQAAIATGRHPSGSGVINNRFYDRRLQRKLEGEPEDFSTMLLTEPIWVAAARAKVPVAATNWMATAGQPGVRTTSVHEDGSDAQRIEELLGWIAERGPQAPRLMLVYLEGLDDVSHKRGPDAGETLRAVEGYDGFAGSVLEALRRHRAPHATLLLLGDHGMATVSRCIYLKAFLRRRGFDADPYSTGGSANVYFHSAADAARAREALRGESALLQAYLPAELPEGWRYRQPDRIGDLILIGKPGTYFRDLGGESNPVGPARIPGAHGFAPDDPSMAGTLFAWGRGIAAGSRWAKVQVVDVYRTVCALLGLEPAAGAAGRSLADLRPAARSSMNGAASAVAARGRK